MEQTNFSKAFYELNKSRKQQKKLDLFLNVYSLLGLLIALLAVGYFVLTTFEPTKEQQITLTIAGIGVALAFMSRTLLLLCKNQAAEEMENTIQYNEIASLLSTWDNFARVGKETLSKENHAFNRHSLKSMIGRLYEEGKINKNDIMALEKALQIRNAIVHGEKYFSIIFTKKITKSLEALTNQISQAT